MGPFSVVGFLARRDRTMIVLALGVGSSFVLVRHQRRAHRLAERDKDILRFTAVATSKETVKEVISDNEVHSQLKTFGINILKEKKTQRLLKDLVKALAKDQDTKDHSKQWLKKNFLDDMWVREEVLRRVRDVEMSIKEDKSNIVEMILRGIGAAAVVGLSTEEFKADVRREVLQILFEILKGEPRYPPTKPK